MTCDNISSVSVLHVAVQGGYEQVVNNIVELVQQLPPTKEPFVNTRNRNGWVSVLLTLLLKLKRVM